MNQNHKTGTIQYRRNHMSVKRVYVEKKPEFAVKAGELREEISSYLSIDTVTGVRVLIRYDIENLSEETSRRKREIPYFP